MSLVQIFDLCFLKSDGFKKCNIKFDYFKKLKV